MKGNEAMRPQPIAEIVVTRGDPRASILRLFAATPDADGWIRENTREFGILFVPEDSRYNNYFSLHVDDNYIVDEVIDYIRSVGKDSTDDPAALFSTIGPGADNE